MAKLKVLLGDLRHHTVGVHSTYVPVALGYIATYFEKMLAPQAFEIKIIVHPDEDGPHPVILFLMDAPGMREELHQMVRRIATCGYWVMLPNLYYRRVEEFVSDGTEKGGVIHLTAFFLRNCEVSLQPYLLVATKTPSQSLPGGLAKYSWRRSS